jgi:hypothetical protein
MVVSSVRTLGAGAVVGRERLEVARKCEAAAALGVSRGNESSPAEGSSESSSAMACGQNAQCTLRDRYVALIKALYGHCCVSLTHLQWSTWHLQRLVSLGLPAGIAVLHHHHTRGVLPGRHHASPLLLLLLLVRLLLLLRLVLLHAIGHGHIGPEAVDIRVDGLPLHAVARLVVP